MTPQENNVRFLDKSQKALVQPFVISHAKKIQIEEEDLNEI